MPYGRAARPFTRTIATTALAALAIGATAFVGVPSATGQVPAPDDTFILGSGRSEARLLRVGPSAGQLSLAPVIGISLTDYLNNLARAESRIADYAALESSIPPELLEATPSLKVASSDEGADEGRSTTTAGAPEGSPSAVGVTRQSVRADDTPQAEAGFELGAFDVVPGVIELGGGRAVSSTEIIDGATREATGTTTFGSISLGGGAVVLEGLRWEAVQRTGAETAEVGTFSIEGITAGGQSLPVPTDPAELAAALEQLNPALAPLGLQIIPPSISTDAGVARISPLTIRGGDSEVGNTVLGPAIGALQPVRQPVADALIGANPEFATAFLLADVMTGVLSGGSTFDIQLGGASAFTEGVAFDDPFGDIVLGDFDLGAAPTATTGFDGTGPSFGSGGSLGTDGTLGTPGTPGTPPTPGTPGTVGPGSTTGAPSQLTGSTISSNLEGPAVLVGILGLLASLAMAGADWQRLRSGARLIPEVAT